MSASQEGKTPRRTARRNTATPIRDVSPPARGTRAASTALQGTPATRRSARAASRRPDQPRDVVNNNVLPEIQTRQSYAYGSSKTPLLPEQLQVRDTLTMKQVADQMNTAINRAEQNLDSRAAELDGHRNQIQTQADPNKTQPRTSRDASPPISVITEVQKKQRTAAWASSLEDSQLEDITEEERPQLDTPDTRRTEPSEFPSGIFDQSYQYERGLRPPRRPPNVQKRSFGSRVGASLGATLDRLVVGMTQAWQEITRFGHAVTEWFSRLFKSIVTGLSELPDSKLVSTITKLFFVMAVIALINYTLCFSYTRFSCDPLSTSKVSQAMQSWCGTCQSASAYSNVTGTSSIDVQKVASALKLIDTQIRSIESRMNSRLDNQVSALYTNIDGLRQEQSKLIQQLEHVSNQASQPTTSSEIASPLIPRVNYFSPANGALINPKITSPTRQAPIALSLRLLSRLLGIQKYKSYNPITALEPWHDVGECWCAAATDPGQDSIRLGVGVREYIYPTELIIEHPPRDVSLTPETAPRRVELWADFDHLQQDQWKDLGIEAMAQASNADSSPFGKTFGLIASVEYDLSSHANHIQRFALDVNQYGDLKYSALDFALRVRSTYGGEYGCLYRVRLHGVPVEKPKFAIGSQEEAGSEIGHDQVIG